MSVSAEKKKAIVLEVKKALRKKSYTTRAQMFADIALQLRKKGVLVKGKSIGGTDTIRKIWEEYCSRDFYWNTVNTKVNKNLVNYIGREASEAKKKAEEFFALRKNITTDDFLTAIAITGLSEDVVREIKRKKTCELTTVRKKPSGSLATEAAIIEEKICNLEKLINENASRLAALAAQMEKEIKRFKEDLHAVQIEVDNAKALSKAAWRLMTEEMVQLRKDNQLKDALNLFCRYQTEAWKKLYEELSIIRPLKKLPNLSTDKDGALLKTV